MSDDSQDPRNPRSSSRAGKPGRKGQTAILAPHKTAFVGKPTSSTWKPNGKTSHNFSACPVALNPYGSLLHVTKRDTPDHDNAGQRQRGNVVREYYLSPPVIPTRS